MSWEPLQNNTGEKVAVQDLVGRPLIVWVNDYKRNVGTSNTARTGKLADPVICDIVDLRPMTQAEPILHRNVWIFTGSLIKVFKSLVGSPARLILLTQTGNAFGGRSYVIQDMSGDARATELAQAWMDANPEFVRSDAPPDPPPYVPQEQFQGQQQNHGWPQGSVPAQQWQQGPPQQQPQYQQPQYAPQPQFQQPQVQPAWQQPQQAPQQWQQQPTHHEQGPPPAWAQQPVQQAPVQPQLPPAPPQAGPPAPGSILERLANQHANNAAARQGQPYNPEEERQQYGY